MNTEKLCEHCGKPVGARSVHGLCPECFFKVGLGSEAPGAEGSRTFDPPAADALAPWFPQLEILQLLGKGGMGAVYKARQKGLNRQVALKILPPAAGGDPAFAQRFTREAQALAQLNHPGIVAVYEFGHTPGESNAHSASAESAPRPRAEQGFYYFVMEFVDGVNLRQMLQAHRLSPREAMAIVPQICEALQYAHDQGIVHRDIKPENVLVDKQGRVKIADFGLAKLLGKEVPAEPLTRPAEVMGTPQYMAPEQVEHPLEVDHRADIYSLGVVFYEMLTGELPLGRFPAPSRKVEVDVRLDEIVLRALEKEPQLRFQQASAFKTVVETVAKGAPSTAHEKGTRAAATARWWGFGALGLLLVAVLGTLALLAVSSRDDLALAFGGLSLTGALVFGILGWKDPLAKALTVLTAVIFLGIGVAVVALIAPFPGRQRSAEEEQRRLKRELEDTRQALRAELERATPPIAADQSTQIVQASPVPSEPLSSTRPESTRAAPERFEVAEFLWSSNAFNPLEASIAPASTKTNVSVPEPLPSRPQEVRQEELLSQSETTPAAAMVETEMEPPFGIVPRSGHPLVEPPEVADRIERLVQSAEVRIGHDFELWEKTRGRQGDYRIRDGVKRVPLQSVPASGRRSKSGEVFYLPDDDRFYIQWDARGADVLHFYGPFEGDPVRILHLPRPDPSEEARELEARLASAKEIASFVQRDKALAVVARDSANAGLADIATRALREMVSFTERDQVSRRAARLLARNNQRSEALAIARQITSFSERDQALKELAEQSTPASEE